MKLKMEVFQVPEVQQQLVFTGSPAAVLELLQTLAGAFPYYPKLEGLLERKEVAECCIQSERWK